MAAMEVFCEWLMLDLSQFSKKEIYLLEGEFFAHLCTELTEVFRKQHEDYFCLMNFSKKMENDMLDNHFVRLILSDILSTGEYNRKGIACYAFTFEDVIQEVLDGCNINPSATLLRRCITLHRSVRRDLYRTIIQKFFTYHLKKLKLYV